MTGEIHKTDERVRERAYHLWERAGRPHGRNDEFWDQAFRQILTERGAENRPDREAEKE